MVTKVQLTLSTTEFERLHELADGRKSTIKVDRDSLAKLLLDHGRALSALSESSSFKVEEPVEIRRREKRKP